MQSRVTRRLSNIWLEMSPRPKQPDLASVQGQKQAGSNLYSINWNWSGMKGKRAITGEIYSRNNYDDLYHRPTMRYECMVQWTTITRILLVYLVSQHLYHGRRGVIIPAFSLLPTPYHQKKDAISSKTVIRKRNCRTSLSHREPSKQTVPPD